MRQLRSPFLEVNDKLVEEDSQSNQELWCVVSEPSTGSDIDQLFESLNA